MAISNINVGTFPNDNTGDALRNAMIKTNDNFTSLDSFKVDKITGKSLSTNDYTNHDVAVVTNLSYLTGYTPANIANLQNSMVLDGTGTKFPTVDAVNNQVNSAYRVNVATGFIDTSDAFRLYMVNDTTLGVSASTYGISFSQYYKTPPYAPSTGIKPLTARTVALSIISGLTGVGNTVRFVGYQASTDSIVFSNASFVQSPSICQLGIVLIKFSGGVTTFIDAIRNVITIPDIAAYSNLETTVLGYQSNVIVTYNDGALGIKNSGGAIKGISANWGNASNNDERPISASTATTFTLLSPANATQYTATTITQNVDPTLYWNGSALVAVPASNNATVQRFLVTLRGNIACQYGETFYTNFSVAKANAATQTFSDVLPTGTYVEIGRLIITKSCTNLSDTTVAEFLTTGGGSTFGTINPQVSWGVINGTIAAQTDLQAALDAKINIMTAATNTIPKILASNTLGTSNLFDNGTVVTSAVDMTVNSVKAGRGAGNIISNTMFGNSSLATNSTGSGNTAVGINTLNLGTSDNNTAIGANVLQNTSTGNKNTGVGTNALIGNTTGLQNVAVGYNAGRYLANGSTANINGTNNVYIGIETQSSAASQSNEIVIGSNLTGLGSNTAVLGNSSITITRLRGEVRGGSFVKDGGLSTQYLMADGSVSTGTTGGGGSVSGSGTSGKIPLWNGSTSLTNAVVGVDYSLGTYLLATGIVKNTTGTGALSIAVAGDFPTLNQNTTGNAATASQVAFSGITNFTGTGSQFIKGNGTLDSTVYTSNLGTVTSVAALTLGTTGTDLSSSVANSGTTPVITLNVPTASASNRGALSSTDWSTFNNKQATLVSGTNIKTINGSSILGSGNLVVSASDTYVTGGTYSSGTATFTNNTGGTFNVTGFNTALGTVTTVSVASANGFTGSVANATTTPAITLTLQNATTSQSGQLTSTDWNTFNGKQATLVSGTSIKTINSTSVLGSGDIAVQATLVSGTNIKTINGNSILGSGDLTVAGGGGGTTVISGNTIVGTSYTILSSDHAKQLQVTAATAVTILVPSGLTVGFACDIIQEGAGQVTISGGSGTTLRYSSFELPKTFEQYSIIGIEAITNLTDNYKLMGQLSSI